MTVNFSLRNEGTTATSNLQATLQPSDNVITGDQTVSYGALAPGATATRAFTFTISGACGSTIPVTYVPARNTVFLACALGLAEVLEAQHIYIGVNAVDYSGYPDCRPGFIRAFEQLANLATRAAVEGRRMRIHAPLIDLAKDAIIRRGLALGVDYALTVSCYQADEEGRACGRCDSCRLRREGFRKAGVPDPTNYAGD